MMSLLQGRRLESASKPANRKKNVIPAKAGSLVCPQKSNYFFIQTIVQVFPFLIKSIIQLNLSCIVL